MHQAAILTVGDELLNGAVLDSNSAFLAEILTKAGFRVSRKASVPDEVEAIVDELRVLAERSDLVIVTGGLGPTSDDLTRDAIAQFLGSGLAVHEGSLSKLEAYAQRRGVKLNENNRRQAFFPLQAEVITNRAGSADAFAVSYESAGRIVPIFALPGVPKEMRILMEEEILSRCCGRFPGLVAAQPLYLKCFGLSEAHIGRTIEAAKLPPAVNVAYRPRFPEILLTLTLKPFASSGDPAMLHDAARTIEQALGPEFVFSRSAGVSLAQVVGHLLSERKLTLACAESCSGGLLAHEIVSCPGASQYFRGAVVAYHNDVKHELLGVKEETLAAVGAVSEQCVKEMAAGAKHRTAADIALAITGIAGPEGGTAEKPVGTVWLALAAAGEEHAFRYHLAWDRDYVRRYAVALALDLVRRWMLGNPLTWNRV